MLDLYSRASLWPTTGTFRRIRGSCSATVGTVSPTPWKRSRRSDPQIAIRRGSPARSRCEVVGRGPPTSRRPWSRAALPFREAHEATGKTRCRAGGKRYGAERSRRRVSAARSIRCSRPPTMRSAADPAVSVRRRNQSRRTVTARWTTDRGRSRAVAERSHRSEDSLVGALSMTAGPPVEPPGSRDGLPLDDRRECRVDAR